MESNLDNNESNVKAENDESNSKDVIDAKVMLNSNDLEDESKESAIKRMRVNNTGAGVSGQVNLNSNNNVSVSASAAMAQNNAAYVAAAQSYHNALAAMNYTGVSLQANKNPQVMSQQQQVQASHNYPQAVLSQGGPAANYQQNQQQQLLSQYQAMAAAFAGQQQAGAFQQAQLGGGQMQQQQNNMNYNPATAGFNQLAAAAAMNPYLASIPQLAAAQRASMLTSQQGGGPGMGAASAYANPSAYGGVQPGAAASAAFNPFGMQFGTQVGGQNAALQFQQNPQALLAAYGQFARAPGPVVSAASGTIPTQQLYVGNPVAAAAAAAAANGPLQPGVKRMRPA